MTKEKVIPQIRFSGFTDTWEQRKFSDIAETRRGLTYKPNSIVDNGVRVLRSSNINEDTFVFGNDDVFVDENAVNIPYIQNGDILITSANGSSRLVGKHAIIRNLPDNSAVHGGFMLIASSSNPEFLNASMSSQWYSEFVSLYVAGGNGAIGNLNKNDLDTQIVLVPSVAEQQQIGSYFRNLDNLITLHQRKYDKLTKVKKAMLEKMFPENGSPYPEIRFKGFTDAWEQRKFSDIAETRRGLTYKPNSIVDNGVRVLRSSNINEDTFVFGNDDVFVDENAVNIPYIQNGDILITSANGSSRLVGKHAIIRNLPDNSAVHGGFMLIASSSNPEFLNASMSSQWYSEFVSLYVAGGNGAIGNLNKNDLDTQIVLVPSVAEQQQIGSYFRNLDNLITLHQRKLEKLKNIKKACLEKMFV